MTPFLEISGVSHSYHTLEGETKALSHISFTVQKGEFLAIVGPSGCGKTTLLTLLDGLVLPEEGSIRLEGQPVKSARRRIGYMFQKDCLFEWRSILENVSLGLEIRQRASSPHPAAAPPLPPDAREELLSMLKTYGLASFAGARPSELSGGMRQRAALIRTLVLEPDLLLLDEPFSSLDYQTRLNVGDDIGQIIRREKKAVILVTHDLSEAISLADRVIVLSGRPASIRQTIPLRFDLASDTPMNRRGAPEFKTYFNLIWKELNNQ